MHKEILLRFKEDLKKFAVFVIISYILLQLWYYKESPINVIKVVFAHIYLFILPGFAMMLYFKDKIEFMHRLIIGAALGYSSSILLTIYINAILKINISYYYWISPLILIMLGVVLASRKVFKKAS